MMADRAAGQLLAHVAELPLGRPGGGLLPVHGLGGAEHDVRDGAVRRVVAPLEGLPVHGLDGACSKEEKDEPSILVVLV